MPTNNYSSIGNNNDNSSLSIRQHNLFVIENNQKVMSNVETIKGNASRNSGNINFVHPKDHQNKIISIAHANLIPKHTTKRIEHNSPMSIPVISVPPTVNNNIRINNCNNVTINQHYITPQFQQKQYNISQPIENKKASNPMQLRSK
jgi:hypothetical protein